MAIGKVVYIEDKIIKSRSYKDGTTDETRTWIVITLRRIMRN